MTDSSPGGRGGGRGGIFLSESGICTAVTLIQSGSSVASKGFLGRFGLRIHPSPGGLGISTLEDAVSSNHHLRLSDDGGGTIVSKL